MNSQDNSPDVRREANGMTEGAGRWTLSRAGIINVYQYDNEILHFAGGRLLLRGINGSGKSTAMNMLLPFLLDADTRRIDAAGEQSGMLRSWMLSGRDEPQPQGYLWLEVAKGDSYLAFGCGIRASRSAEQVTTWWFITSRRPGLDLHLVDGRVPLSREALRAAIGSDPVYGQEQRPDYRAELRRRLFGGADIEQHLHLLRIVRNPRVGDRLDAELPQYLQDALPQLSEAALDDAAQPLEDLEEHRRNVTDLGRTAEALRAMSSAYRNYARTELHRLTDRTHDAARLCRDRRNDEEKARRAHTQALDRHRIAEARKRVLAGELQRLRTVIAALEASEGYKSGAQLNDLRDRVESLGRNQAAAAQALERLHVATERAASAVQRARQDASTDHDALRCRLSDLASLSSGCALTARPPGLPSIASGPDSADGLERVPPEPLATAADDRALSALSAAARQRIEEVESVEAALERVEAAERTVQEAERAAAEAESTADQARRALADALASLQSAIESWQDAVSRWLQQVQQHHDTHGLEWIQPPPEAIAVRDDLALERIGPALESWIAPTIRRHEGLCAEREAALKRQREIVHELEAREAELAAKELPDPPLLGWQQRTGRCLAELVDFKEHLDGPARAGLEGALEASGLLAAEVHRGALRLADGQVVIAPDDNEVAAPLSGLLRSDAENGVDADMRGNIERILRAISTDPAAGADTVVTPEGEFRLGALCGRHLKREAEHIGVSARRAALERQRAQSALALAQAKEQCERLADDAESARAALDEAVKLRARIPSDRPLQSAMWQRNSSQKDAQRAEEQLSARRSALQSAELRHAEAVAHAQGTAARLSLPATLRELRGIRDDLGRIIQESRDAQRGLVQLARAIDRWRDRGEDWQAARDNEEQSRSQLVSVEAELSSASERLKTLDATVGVAYREVVAAISRQESELAEAERSREQTETELEQAAADVSGAQKDCDSAAHARERADAECRQTVDFLQRALTVPGLIEVAVEPPKDVADGIATAAPAEEDEAGALRATLAGGLTAAESPIAAARHLTEAIRTQVPRSEEPPTTAEGVRQSIRRRRDSLGAGWDAEDRQPDEHLPLHVEVTGPLAQQTPLPAAAKLVESQLGTLSSLLSTKQHQALRNLLQGLVAREIAGKLHAAAELIERMNERLSAITTSHGIGVRLRWRRREDLDPALAETIDLLAKTPDLRTTEEDRTLSEALGRRIDDAHREDPGAPYRELIARVLDYRAWHAMTILLERPGRSPERLSRRTALSEGEKKLVSYLPLFAAVAASCDGLAAVSPEAPRFILLDDAFAKVSEDNHPKLFGLLVELDLDFIATSERLWGTHETVPQLAITEVIRDADLATIVLEHSRWDGRRREMGG
ncbi:MAG TPA: TIGR02680 family protein [Steroidobacteraceae bacterium]|nr:TIGR02680 family protein [Steroidobacteraceae bacterium]